MGAAGVQMVCVGLGLLGLVAGIVCCAVPKWKESSFSGQNIVTAQVTQDGLWMSCVVQSTGQQQCKTYDSLLILSADLQAARAMTIISCLLSALSIFLLFAAADFTTCVQNEVAKPRVALIAGIGFIVAGTLLLIPVSWSAHNVIRAFRNPLNPQKKELGACIFVGWAGSTLLLLGGGLLCCFSRPKAGRATPGTAKYHSNGAGAGTPSKNYV